MFLPQSCISALKFLERGSAVFPAKDQVVNILGTEGHVVSAMVGRKQPEIDRIGVGMAVFQ